MSRSPRELAVPGPWEHLFIHTHGIRLHVAAAGSPQAPLVLLLHDALGGWFDYRGLLPLLAPSFRAVAASARGFAPSDIPPSGYSIRYGVGDLSGLIRALGHEAAVVVAHGSATRLATTLAANYPERVLAVLALAPPRRLRPLQARRHVAIARLAHRLPDLAARRSLFGIDAPGDLEELRSLSYQVRGTAPARIRHAQLPLLPLPIGWHGQAEQPLETLESAAHIATPDLCAERIAAVAAAGG